MTYRITKFQWTILAFCALSLIAPLALTLGNRVVDPFLHMLVTPVISDSALPYVEAIPAMPMLLRMLALTTGLHVDQLMYLPLGAILIFVGLVYLGGWLVPVQLGRPYIISAIAATAIMLKVVIPPYVGIWPHGIGTGLLLILVGNWLRSFQASHQLPRLITTVACYAALPFYSYTAEAWALILVASFLVIHTMVSHARGKVSFNLLALFAVYTLIFNRILYRRYAGAANFGTLAEDFLHVIGFSARKTVQLNEYVWRPWGTFASVWGGRLWLFILAATLVLFMINVLRTPDKLQRQGVKRLMLYVGGVTVLAAVDPLVYGLVGGLSGAFLRAPLLLLPLAIPPMLFVVFGSQRAAVAPVLVLILIGATITPMFLLSPAVTRSPDGYTSVDPSAHWFISSYAGGSLLTDHHTGGRFLINAVALESNWTTEDLVLHTEKSYSDLVEGRPSSVDFIAVGIVFADAKTWAGGWRDFEPMSRHLTNVLNGENNLIYTDSYVAVMKSPPGVVGR